MNDQQKPSGGRTDRELLELAARAAGLELEWVEGFKDTAFSFYNGVYWNPLISDGDALRLAATLSLIVKPGKHKGDGCTVESQRAGIAGCTAFRDNEYEQMRYAIVFVSAEIGAAL